MQMDGAPYIIGIDLGTTNCALAFIDVREGRTVRDFPVTQFVAAGVREARELLPSSLHALSAEDRTPEDTRVDPRFRAGYYAREMAARAEARGIQSAKSWLCHPLVDREAPILPWSAAPEVPKISPIDAQAILLTHLRVAWDDAHPDAPLAEQETYLAVPASFDEAAREYTLAAARKAGLPVVRLLEEPQAAFYAWLAAHESTWQEHLRPGDIVWVCDVGGGTTDFTLIEVRSGENGAPILFRSAVGEHLILGGDNMDLAIALELEPKWGVRLDAASLPTAVSACRAAKETLLAENAPDELEVVLPGRGTNLIGGARRATARRKELCNLLLHGFLPDIPFDAQVQREGSALQVFGLPHARDAAITRHAAEFLRRHLPRTPQGAHRPPTAILFNGGFFSSPLLVERFLHVARNWFNAPDRPWNPVVLQAPRLDVAVARGGAYFGLARRGAGVRIRSTLGRAYYLGLGATRDHEESRALCIAPADLETGRRIELTEAPLRARVNAPVSFRIAHSHTRLHDRPGTLCEWNSPDLIRTDPIRATLSAGANTGGELIDVTLSAELTEIGTLDVRLRERGRKRDWRLSFEARESLPAERDALAGPPMQQVVDGARVEAGRAIIAAWFGSAPSEAEGRSIFKTLERAAGMARSAWPASLCRAWWNEAAAHATMRRTSPAHEIGWLNLTGFLLRPGYGYPGDEARAQQLWQTLLSGIAFQHREPVRCAAWIFWRRIAGGLTRGQQNALAEPLARALKRAADGKAAPPLSLKRGSYETAEAARLIASLERWSSPDREFLAERILEAAAGRSKWLDTRAARWALARIGARQPSYGPLNAVLSVEFAERALDVALRSRGSGGGGPDDLFLVVALARRTGDRMRDVGEAMRARALEALRARGAPEHYLALIERGGDLEKSEQDSAFGERLPDGLVL